MSFRVSGRVIPEAVDVTTPILLHPDRRSVYIVLQVILHVSAAVAGNGKRPFCSVMRQRCKQPTVFCRLVTAERRDQRHSLWRPSLLVLFSLRRWSLHGQVSQ